MSLACLLPACQLLILLLMIVKSLKSYLYCSFWNCMVFGIRTDLAYRFYFSISFDMLSLIVLTYTMLSLVTRLISPSCHAITWHLADILDSYNYHDNRMQPKLPVRPEGLQVFRGERWLPTFYYIHEKRQTIRPSSRPYGRFRTPATERHGP